MGQYFRFINYDKKEFISPFDYNNGAKVMEHSYQQNKFLAAAEKLMKNEWEGDRVLYVGDYVDECYDNPKFEDLFNELKQEIKEANLFKEDGYTNESLYNVNFKHIVVDLNKKDLIPSRYIYNSNTKEYIDLKQQLIQWTWYEKEKHKIYGVKIHPLSLSLCVSNGGGGSYQGAYGECVGLWANDSASIDFTDTLSDLSEYKPLLISFNENKTIKYDIPMLKDRIKKEIDNISSIEEKKTFVARLKIDEGLFLNEAQQKELKEFGKEYVLQSLNQNNNKEQKDKSNKEDDYDYDI